MHAECKENGWIYAQCQYNLRLSLYSQNKKDDMINLQYFSDFNMSIILLITEKQNSIP